MPGEQPRIADLVKLNTNENPFRPRRGRWRRFGPPPSIPWALSRPRGTALREALTGYHGVGSEHVFVGNGSDEVLAHAFVAS